jgi:type II secretory pathway predicted ATPase ExeA
MNTVEKIKTAVQEARKQGQHPTRVHLTVDDGRKLEFELMTEDRLLGHRIEKEGLRHAVHKIAGLEVVWRSPEFKVE